MKAIKALCVALPLMAVSHASLAEFPDRPIKLVAPYATGGSSDLVARAFSDKLGEALGQTVVVENKAGAGSMIGTGYVATEKPDGYTLLLVDVPFTIIPALYKDRVKYDPKKDFKPVGLIGVAPMYLFVGSDSPVKSVADLIAQAKQKPNGLSIGSGGNGSFTHLLAELFMASSGTQLTHVPYRSAAASVNDLAGKQIDVSFSSLASASALFEGGRVRPIGTTQSEAGAKANLDVETFSQAGLKNMDAQSWWGVVAPAGTPQPVIDKIEAAMASALQTDLVKRRLAGVGVTTAPDNSSAALQKTLDADFPRWETIIRDANISAE